MINESFYPTPPDVIDRMVRPIAECIELPEREQGRYKLAAETRWYIPGPRILEPSAGKGDILDHLMEHYNMERRQVACIEIDLDLQATLMGKHYEVIDGDFLAFCEPYRADTIVMNPPFADGVSHLLKAWEIVNDGGHVVCLLNAESILNPHTRERQLLLDIIETYGRYEVIGPVFKAAERPTDVNVAIVWLEKPEKEKSVDFEDTFFEQDDEPDQREFSPNPLANRDTIQSLVDQYQAAAVLLQQRYELNSKLKYYTRNTCYRVDDSSERDLIEQNDELKAKFWQHLFEKTSVGKYATSDIQRDFDRMVTARSRMAFSMNNIYAVLEKLFFELEDIAQRCIVQSFDDATQYHEKNKVWVEGWKTNKAWRLNKKIIYPGGIRNEWSWGLDHHQKDFYNDIDKALCFVSGQQFDKIHTTVNAIDARCIEINQRHVDYQRVFESTFFTIRLYKKGTTHLTFKDLDLLAQFNQAAAKGKHWVGDGS